jgi:hypothetical protein
VSIKLRIPNAWEGCVHSASVRVWLQDFFQQPRSLPPDPGVDGEARVSLSVPPRAIKVLEGLTGDSPSAALRRLIAGHVPALQSRSRLSVAALPGRAQALPPAWANPEPTSRTYGPSALRCDSIQVSPETAQTVLASIRQIQSWVICAGIGLALWRLMRRDTAQPAPKPVPALVRELPRFRAWIPVGLGGE